MSFKSQLTQLILTNNSQLINLRIKAINGNKQILQLFNNSIMQLLKDKNYHHYAYHQINQLLISAKPDIVAYVNNNILNQVANTHCRQDLDQYIMLWKNIINSQNKNYPKIQQKLKNIKLKSQRKQMTQPFLNFKRIFNRNYNQIFEKHIQFFDDTFSNNLNYSSEDQIIEYDTIQANSQQIQKNMKQIEQIKQNIQNGSINNYNLKNYVQKIRRFLALKPISMRKQLSVNFNTDRVWAKQFIDKYYSQNQKLKYSDIKYSYNPVPNQRILQVKKQNIKDIDGFASDKKQNNANTVTIPTTIKKQTYPNEVQKSGQFGEKPPFILNQKIPQLPFSSFNTIQQSQQPNSNMNTNFILPTNIRQQNFNIKQENYSIISQNSFRRGHNNQIFNRQGQQSQTIPYDISNFQKNKNNQNIFSSSSPMKYSGQSNNNQILITSKSEQNLFSSRPRPKIFGIKKSNKYQDPDQQNLVITIHKKNDSPNNQNNQNVNRNTLDSQSNKYTNLQKQNIDPINKQYGISQQGFNPQTNSSQGGIGLTVIPYNRLTFLTDHSPYNSSQNQLAGRKKIPGITTNSLQFQQNQIFNSNRNYPNQDQISIQQKQKQTRQYGSPGLIKLSQFAKQKQKRKQQLADQKLFPLEDYLLQPYTRNFEDYIDFNRFRRNCLMNNFILYSSPMLMITCYINRISDSKAQIQLVYKNLSNCYLEMETLYRIPKCMKIQKYSKIHKNWLLEGQQIHIFAVILNSFPLQPNLLNLKYSAQSKAMRVHNNHPKIITLPITMQNFLNYTVINQFQWRQKYKDWISQQNFHITRHILFDKSILEQTQLDQNLLQFTKLTPKQGYSIKQFGACCLSEAINQIVFLLHISHRFNNIMSFELLADRKKINKDQYDYLEYCLNIWCMLLTKVQENRVQ